MQIINYYKLSRFSVLFNFSKKKEFKNKSLVLNKTTKTNKNTLENVIFSKIFLQRFVNFKIMRKYFSTLLKLKTL